MPERTHASVPHFLRELYAVVASSLPVLVAQGLVVVSLVYLDQGRVFLLLDHSLGLLCLITLGAVATVVFTRVLARRVDPDPTPNPNSPDRLRWLALQCGSGIAGLISGFLPAALIERFLADRPCGLPEPVLTSYRASANLGTILVATTLIFYLAWRLRARRNEGTMKRDIGMLVAVLGAATAANLISARHHLLVFGVILILASVALTITVLKGPAPVKARGGILEWRAGVLALVFLVFGLVLAIFPGSLRSGVALLILVGFWTAVAVLLTVLFRCLWAKHLVWFTVALTLLIGALFSLWTRAFQSRDIRTLAGRQAAARPALDDFARSWLRQRMLASSNGEPYTVILVGAAGGGIRAAYWTANLLAAFQDQYPAFSEHLFAISGVSGGSVGATFFDSLIAGNCSPCRPAVQTALRGDFLSPALSSLLTRDVASTIFHVNLPDRGVALEEAFELAWRETVHTQTLEDGLERLWQADPTRNVPALFLNATEAGSARRAVFSNISFIQVSGVDARIQEAAEKLPLRLSTAMLLSARFPYVSPEGRVPLGNAPFRFVDGGYFDNSGAATLIDAADALYRAIAELGAAKQFRIAVLMIQNEPAAVAGCSQKFQPGGLGTPVGILDELRSQRATQFAAQLRTRIGARDSDIYLDSFRPDPGTAEFPLGWTLPAAAADEMDSQIVSRMKNPSTPVNQLLHSLQQILPTR